MCVCACGRDKAKRSPGVAYVARASSVRFHSTAPASKGRAVEKRRASYVTSRFLSKLESTMPNACRGEMGYKNSKWNTFGLTFPNNRRTVEPRTEQSKTKKKVRSTTNRGSQHATEKTSISSNEQSLTPSCVKCNFHVSPYEETEESKREEKERNMTKRGNEQERNTSSFFSSFSVLSFPLFRSKNPS